MSGLSGGPLATGGSVKEERQAPRVVNKKKKKEKDGINYPMRSLSAFWEAFLLFFFLSSSFFPPLFSLRQMRPIGKRIGGLADGLD